MKKETTGTRIRAVRKSLGMSQKRFAEVINVIPPTLCAYEKDRTAPALQALMQIATIGNVTMDWLCGLSQEPEVKSFDPKCLLYKIFYDTRLVYVGKTEIPLEKRLYGHVANEPTMCQLDINKISKIEFAEVKTQADLYLYWVYLVNLYKPVLNEEYKSSQPLSFELPPLTFQEHSCEMISRWKRKTERMKQAQKEYKLQLAKLNQEKRRKKKEFHQDLTLTTEEQEFKFREWESSVYEPELQKLEAAVKQAELEDV